MLTSVDRALSKVEDVCGGLAAIGLGAIMLIVASDVALRYIFGRPWTWSYDFVGIYLTVAIFYLALSRTMRERGHINVDLLHSAMSFRTRHICDCFICVVSTGFFALIAVIFAKLAWTQYSSEDVISSVVDWPLWASTIFVPIGTILIVSRLSLLAVGHAQALWTGLTPPILASRTAAHSISTGE